MTTVVDRLSIALATRYTIEREIGRGGMATVYLAQDLKHDRTVAIKVLQPELSATIGTDRFDREIRVAAKLQHPHILTLYDSGDADGLLYYVMPFISGESLRGRMDREHLLPIDDALQITREVADALGYAHSMGVVHRDIKPENILLSGGHALVADFGIARAVSSASSEKRLTETGMALGTPLYMSPEQAVGDEVGPTSDLYSLACVLYEMLAGTPPFVGPNSRAIMARHAMDPVPGLQVIRDTVPMKSKTPCCSRWPRSPPIGPRPPCNSPRPSASRWV
jgi:serine/threonine-protein kinase